MAEISEKGKVSRRKYDRNLPAISIAIEEGKIEIIDELLSQLSDLPIDLSNHKDTALFYLACISGTVDLLKKFTDSGFLVDSPLKTTPEALPALRTYLGFTGLHFAFKYHRLGSIQYLLNQGASIFIPNNQGTTPLHVLFETKKQALENHSSLESYDQIINIILQTDEQSQKDEMEGTDVSHFHIACTRDVPETIQNYLQNGAYIDQTVGAFPGHEGFSALHFAVKYECVKVVEFLLENGADTSLVDYNNRTALHLAESPELALSLLHHATDLASRDSNSNTPLHKAFKEKSSRIVHSLLSLVDDDDDNSTNTTPHDCTRDIKNNENVAHNSLKSIVSEDICLPSRIEIEYEDLPVQGGYDDKSMHEPPIKTIKIDFCVDQNKDLLNQENKTEDLVDDHSSLRDCYTKFCHKCKHNLAPEDSDTICKICSTVIRHQCNRCFKIFFKPQAMVDHLNTSCKMNKYYFSCTECSYRAKTQLKAYNHWVKEHAKPEFKSDGMTVKQRMPMVTLRKEGKISINLGKRSRKSASKNSSITSDDSEETTAETTKKVPFCRTKNCLKCPHMTLPSDSREQ